MKRFSLLLAMAWLSAALIPAGAQPAAPTPSKTETVIVTAPAWLGDKPQTVIHNFVRSYAMAAVPEVDEISRWKAGVCVRTYGLSQDSYNDFVTQRIRAIADQVGALVGPAIGCARNVEIVFTAKPQEFLDQVKFRGSRLLGPRPSQSDTVDTMRYPIQAWYATATRDVYGVLVLNDEENTTIEVASLSQGNDTGLDTVPWRHVDGFKWREGLNEKLAHIYIIADTNRTKNMPLSAVADYAAVLALSQTQDFDSCKPVPSITNLISPNCGDDLKSKGMTDTDFAYLKAVYTMDPGANIQQQQNYLSAEIANALGVH